MASTNSKINVICREKSVILVVPFFVGSRHIGCFNCSSVGLADRRRSSLILFGLSYISIFVFQISWLLYYYHYWVLFRNNISDKITTTHNANLFVGLEYSFNIEIVAIHAKYYRVYTQYSLGLPLTTSPESHPWDLVRIQLLWQQQLNQK